jgi:hypothetical protein
VKPLTFTLSGVGRGLGEMGDDLTIVQHKAFQNCHNESSLYNEYILIKMENKSVFRYVIRNPDVFDPSF